MDVTLHLAQDPDADRLLGRSPLAALIGMLLDQQIPMEWAFKGPATIAQRLGADDLDAHEIAAYDPEAFAALLSEKPAVHRYPGSMAASSSCAGTSSSTTTVTPRPSGGASTTARNC